MSHPSVAVVNGVRVPILRVTKGYRVQPHLNDAMLSYAERHNYTVASCVEAAFAEFLAKHDTPSV